MQQCPAVEYTTGRKEGKYRSSRKLTDRNTYREADRQKATETNQADTETSIYAESRVGRKLACMLHAHREIERERQRQTDRQTETYTHKHSRKCRKETERDRQTEGRVGRWRPFRLSVVFRSWEQRVNGLRYSPPTSVV